MDKCSICGKDFQMGLDGYEDGCDSCLGVERDSFGHAWLPTDYIHLYVDLNTGETIIVTREEALKSQ